MNNYSAKAAHLFDKLFFTSAGDHRYVDFIYKLYV